jgi:hypothetical protein
VEQVAAAWGFCAILVPLAIFQAALAAGAPLGRFAWGGQADTLGTPLRIGSVVAIGLYALFALIVLQRAGLLQLLPLDRPMVGVGAWVIVGYLALGVVVNAISRSKPERYVMTPVALALLALALTVARGQPA